MTDARKNSLDLERWYPSLVSASIVVVGSGLLSLRTLRPWLPAFLHGCSTLAPSALNVSAIAIGFLATSLSILLSLAKTRVIRIMKQAGHYRRLVQFFKSGVSVSFLWAFASAVLTTIHLEKSGVWRYAVLIVWVYLGACSILCYYRTSQILLAVLLLESPEPGQPAREWKPQEIAPSAALDFTDEDS
jgi:hypothetical protein